MTGQPNQDRVTLKDIARLLGVHQSTVSCALRNSSSISEGLRKKIQDTARQLGYEPDPMLMALNKYRTLKHPVPNGTTVGFITDSFTVRRGYGGHFGERIPLDAEHCFGCFQIVLLRLFFHAFRFGTQCVPSYHYLKHFSQGVVADFQIRLQRVSAALPGKDQAGLRHQAAKVSAIQ